MNNYAAKKSKPIGLPVPALVNILVCPTYGKRHARKCLAGKNIYYRSGDPGYRINNYPKTNFGGYQRAETFAPDKKQGRAFVFAMMQEEENK